ncbi:2OG-Fe(II) oxygenase [Marinomonas algicola]|uniref:2OG-Fe(II) oxygenase n=1 Tax=Marinomonas algicola TaxID=2773454 RepID=UPI00174BEDEC|nr:2OG-Fe(II) oxygenase [Marinomonas algicola]
MRSTDTFIKDTSSSQLERARALALPSREAMLNRAPSVQNFWDSNRQLLINAWHEWDKSETSCLTMPDKTLIDSKLRNAVEQAWKKPAEEQAVKALLQEVSPDVFQFQFFDPERLVDLRTYLDAVSDAQIPLRPPYGIVLNRRGAMLDKRSEGFLAAPSFQDFYRDLVDTYMRPIARMLFPDVVGYDTQTFGFSIQWQAGMDASLRTHTDASAATLNINLNLPGEAFVGSEVDFYDNATGEVNRLSFKPGTAMIHRGRVAHAARPITSGTRTNFVLWLYGERGQIPLQNTLPQSIDVGQRWTVPPTKQDDIAPF